MNQHVVAYHLYRLRTATLAVIHDLMTVGRKRGSTMLQLIRSRRKLYEEAEMQMLCITYEAWGVDA